PFMVARDCLDFRRDRAHQGASPPCAFGAYRAEMRVVRGLSMHPRPAFALDLARHPVKTTE
ncbi:MAG: hypothetical protein PF443_09080, partial [Allgaiera sp.]|nr:hypothetical protein [Allgaiera sp.]